MSVNKTSNEEHVEDVDSSSVDSFIKELEEKEKDLDISSDLVIEVDESEVEHDNIHDSFIAEQPLVNQKFDQSLSGTEPQIEQPIVLPPTDQPSDKETEKLIAERDELKEALVRRQRDFDNYRNRTDRERGETFRNVVSNVANQMLPVLDNLNRALDASSDEDGDEKGADFQTFLEGIVLVNQQLNDVLSSMGVHQIPAVGEPFDPRYHEAVEIVETDEYPPKTVIFEILRGYKVDDKVIRASMVKVSSEVSSEKASSEESSDEMDSEISPKDE